MTDTELTPPAPTSVAREDRTMATVVYVLYIIGFPHGLTMLIGIVIAYANLATAGPAMHSHYLFQVRTLWTALAWAVIGVVLLVVGGVLSFVLVGIPFFLLGWAILALLWVWILLRSVVGLVYLSRGEAYPRPRTWLI